MTAKELAARIGGRKYGRELMAEERQLAKDNGLVVVYGVSDDLMEIEGALCEQWYCFNGKKFHFNRNGGVVYPASAPLCHECPHFKSAAKSAAEITAVWHDSGNPCWTYKTDIPHEEFAVYTDEESDRLFCVGIVFQLEDLPDGADADRWIPVTDHLPGPFDVVLICVKSQNGYGEDAYLVTIGGHSDQTDTWMEYTASDNKLADGETVTHWMPLPKPPTMERNS